MRVRVYAHAMLIQECRLCCACLYVYKLAYIAGECAYIYAGTGYLKAGLELSRRIIAREKSNEISLAPLRERGSI